MKILTAANSVYSKDDDGKIDTSFSFKSVIEKTVANAMKFGYEPVVYDLGELGIGEPFSIVDENFKNKGHYGEVKKGYHSRSLFKPEMIYHCLEEYRDLTVYLDGDALLHAPIDEIAEGDYDVGVTLRIPLEMQSEWYEKYADIAKYINAGVIFFNPNPATFEFVRKWRDATVELGNDQKALNKLACPDYYPKIGEIKTFDGVRIKYFSGKKYNNYYFDNGLIREAKIFHFKGGVRQYYPFTLKKQLYCRTVIPVANRVWPHIKKILKTKPNEK